MTYNNNLWVTYIKKNADNLNKEMFRIIIKKRGEQEMYFDISIVNCYC